MLSIQSFNQDLIYVESDEIQSSSSSFLSLENNHIESLSDPYSHLHPSSNLQETSINHFLMNNDSEPLQPSLYHHHPNNRQMIDLKYSSSDWSISNKSSPHPYRDSSHSTVAAGIPVVTEETAPSFVTYDATSTYSQFADVVPSPSNMYPHLNWPVPSMSVNPASSMHMASQTTSESTHTKFDSPDFLLYGSNKRSFTTHLPVPAPNYFDMTFPPCATDDSSIHQRPHNTATYSSNATPKFHPRFKSANARMSPFTEGAKQVACYPPLNDSSCHLMEQDLFTAESSNESVTDLQHNQDTKANTIPFQFDVVLHAPTAVTKKHDEQPVTYLNRGQSYLMDLSSNNSDSGTLTSTISIAFHEPSHRQIAENYWKYWISQQEHPNEARAIDLDINQTTGVYNIRLVSFDRISFDWHSRFGAKVYVRFNCLSTDFSRIKGVKGIPMRAIVETTGLRYMTLPANSLLYKGTFEKLASAAEGYEYKESCYCKIKLFRDKGAERKNKDDKKQMAKQMEKAIALTNGNPDQHPLWPIISQTHKATSCLTEIPTSPDISLNLLDDFNDILIDETNHTPPEFFAKRKRSSVSNQKLCKSVKHSPKKQRATPFSVLNFFVWTQNFSSAPRQVSLDSFTTENLKLKLANVLSIHPLRISEILWRKKRHLEENKASFNSDVLVLVEDTFIAEHFTDGEVMTVDWEIKMDGNLRLILEF